MRVLPVINNIWNAKSGKLIGMDKAHGRVTVEPAWSLKMTSGTTYGSSDMGPYRYWHRADQSQVEVEVPNIKSIDIDRGLDKNAATCTIEVYNQWHDKNGVQPSSGTLGNPGYLGYGYGDAVNSSTAFGQTPNTWQDILIPNALLRCVDVETEILTKRGWLQWDKVQKGDWALGINPKTGRSEWQIINEVFHKHYSGRLTHLKTKVHDSLTTWNHRWLIKHRSGRFDWRTTETLNTRSQIPMSAKCSTLPIEPAYSNDFVELAAWYYTEGSHEHRRRSLDWGGHISQSNNKNPSNVQRIRGCFQRLYGDPGPLPRGKYIPQSVVDEAVTRFVQGESSPQIARDLGVNDESVRRWGRGERTATKRYCWREAEYRSGEVEFLFTQRVGRDLRKAVPGYDKIPSPEFLSRLTQAQLELFVEVSILADGTGGNIFIQGNRERCSAFEMACSLAGKSIHTTFRSDGVMRTTLLRKDITIPVGALAQRGKSPDDVEYDDVVWCPNVEYGNWLARRNGSVYYTGNTFQGYGGYVMSGNDMIPDTISNAMASGNIVITGVWLIDSVVMGTNGMLTLTCRDMAKLLIDQIIFSPLVPQRYSPIKYSRYLYEGVPGTPAQDAVPAIEPVILGPKLLTNFDSDLKRKFGADMNMMGTYDRNVWDGSEDTHSLSAGTVFYDRPYAKNWWEAIVGGTGGADINEVYISPYGIPHWTSGFQFWISIMENGVWQKQLIPNPSLIPATSQPILRHGSTGQAVTDLQNLLNARNGAGLTVDGIFGPLTETAVRNYQTVLGVAVDGVWGPVSQAASDATESTSGIIPWDDANGDGKSDLLVAFFGDAAVENTDIPYVLTGSVPNSTPGIGTWFKLERTYRAEHIRITMVPSWETDFGIWKWRVGLRKVAVKLANVEPVQGHPAVAAIPATDASQVQIDGNIKDWVDPVRELLLWAGFLDYETNPVSAQPWAVIETSGTWPLDTLGEGLFDKKTVIEAITSIKEVLGYIFYVDEYGRAVFTMPNWWSSGNTDENGYRVNYMPEIHDQKVITDYTSTYSDDTARSEVIMGSLLPADLSNTTQYVSVDPNRLINGPDLIRGMVRPAIWTNEVWTDTNEQKLMATLISLHLMFQSKRGSVTCLANPEIQVNDQVRITERVSSESYIHYVRSMRTTMDLDSGEYIMTLGTNWLGEEDNWVFDRAGLLALYSQVANFVGGSYGSAPTGGYNNGRPAVNVIPPGAPPYISGSNNNRFYPFNVPVDPGGQGATG